MKYSICILLLFASVCMAQEFTLVGKVISADTEEPIYLANVRIENESIGDATDIQGEFSLTFDPTGIKYLIVSHVAFETQRFSVSQFLNNPARTIKLTPKVISSQSVLVKGSIGKIGETPISFSKIGRKDIEESYINQDLPEYLSYLPSTTFYSENGNGIGYNYLSIRGFDQRRITVSVNGIPQNDPEDHNVYWLDMPDLLESTELVQVQRGAGLGVIGYPSIGGSINIITSAFANKPKLEISSSLGSYNTRKYTASLSSGLFGNKYSIYAKISKTLSSGYRDRSWVDFNSYHISAVRYDENVTSQINIYGGPISDGLAYYGLPKSYIKNRELRKTNYSRPEEIENFSQPHFELLNEIKLSDAVIINSALFLVLGDGFFDYDGSWAPYSYFRLTTANGFNISGDPDTLYMSNVLIRAMVENKQWGWIPRISITNGLGELIIGGELRLHRSVHWGSINYAEGLPVGVAKDYRYYYYEGAKDIINVFAHQNFVFNNDISGIAELQLAYHKYEISNERYLSNNFSIGNLFINPRVGLNIKLNPEISTYLSFARVSREPRLKNYYDAAESSGGALPQFELNTQGDYNFSNPLVKPEIMNNFELGATYQSVGAIITANIFYMLFDNEIVKKGQVDRFGQPITGNMEKTIHSGIELNCSIVLMDNWEINFNATYSNNYISKGKYYIDDQNYIDLSNNRISGFPNITSNLIVKFSKDGFIAQLFAKYVGDYYSDNYDENFQNYLLTYPDFIDYSDNKVDSYFTMNFLTSFEFPLLPYLNSVKIFLQINNIFDNLYAAYAIGGEFFPAAERNFIAGLKVGF